MVNVVACKQQGAVLLAVLWIIVILLMAASAFSVRVDQLRMEAEQRKQQAELRIRSNDMLAKVAFSVMTGEKSPSGVPWPSPASDSDQSSVSSSGFTSLEDFLSGKAPVVLARTASGFQSLKDDVIDVGDGTRMMVQDRSGLIGFAFLRSGKLYADLGRLAQDGIPAEQLRDTLADYQDRDEYRATHGAESAQYVQQGMPRPTNGFLRTPLQIRHVMAWREALANVDDGWILRNFRVDGGDGININTAPKQVLSLLFPASVQIDQIIEERDRTAFKSIYELSKNFGAQEEYPFIVMPGYGVRVWLWRENYPSATVYDMQFAPENEGVQSWMLNWMARVKLPDELAKRPAKKVDHPFFQ